MRPWGHQRWLISEVQRLLGIPRRTTGDAFWREPHLLLSVDGSNLADLDVLPLL